MEQRLFDCQQMFRHACAFSDIADIAEQRFSHESADIEWYITPAIVNSAFACEVFLKALLYHNNDIEIRKHEMSELFDLLPEQTKERIKRDVMLQYGGIWNDPFGCRIVDDISNAFVDWRYSYELGRNKRNTICTDIGFLTTFRNTLRETCCQLFFEKAWEKYSR